MASPTSKIIPPFDFSKAQSLSLANRYDVCLKRARAQVSANGYQCFSGFPCVPGGATDAELLSLEKRLAGVSLPVEYRQFLAVCRYLKIADGREIGGLDHEGVYVTARPWVSTHGTGAGYLVIANYWRYADGDQLMFDLSEPGQPVIAYLHEHGPLFEFYAPCFSLALWRLIHEGH